MMSWNVDSLIKPNFHHGHTFHSVFRAGASKYPPKKSVFHVVSFFLFHLRMLWAKKNDKIEIGYFSFVYLHPMTTLLSLHFSFFLHSSELSDFRTLLWTTTDSNWWLRRKEKEGPADATRPRRPTASLAALETTTFTSTSIIFLGSRFQLVF